MSSLWDADISTTHENNYRCLYCREVTEITEHLLYMITFINDFHLAEEVSSVCCQDVMAES